MPSQEPKHYEPRYQPTQQTIEAPSSQKENVRVNSALPSRPTAPPSQYSKPAGGVEDLKAKLERFRHEREQSKNNLLKVKTT